MPDNEVRLYRAGDANETGVKAWSSWSPEKSTAESYLDNPGFGGSTLRTESVPLKNILKADTTSARGMIRLARDLGFDPEVGQEWWDNGWKYPWEESSRVKKAASESKYDAIQYIDDFPEGATTVVTTKDFPASQGSPRLQPDPSIPGAYTMSGYRILPGKTNGKLRVYSPDGSLAGVVGSVDDAQRMIQKKLQ
jgi:hypothetical protein